MATLLLVAIFLSGVIFIVDINIPLGIAWGSLYCIIILYSWLFPAKFASVYIAMACTVLVILGFIYSANPNPASHVPEVNRLISIVILWVCAALVSIAKVSFENAEFQRVELEDQITRQTAELRDSEQLYRYLYDHALEMHMSLDPIEATILKCNDTLCKRLGYAESELIGETIIKLYHPDYHDQVNEILTKSKGEVSNVELTVVTKGGGKIDVVLNASPAYDGDGNVRFIRSSWIDITEKKKSIEKFRMLMHSAPDAIIIVNAQGKIELTNYEARRLFGYSKEELSGSLMEMLTLKRNHGLLDFDKACNKMEMELVGVRKNGEQFPAEVTSSLFKSDEEWLAIVAMRDVTIRKKTEGNLKMLYRAIRELEDYSIILLDANGNIQDWNRGARRITGYSFKEIEGKNFDVFYTDSDRREGKPQKQIQKAKVIGRVSEKGWRKRKDGSNFWAVETVTVLNDDMDQTIGFCNILKDLTSQKQAEDTMAKIASLESRSREMEHFAYVISHDLMEPLLTVKNFSELLEEDYGAEMNEDASTITHSILGAAERMEKLIHDLLEYSRLSKPKEIEVINCQYLVNTILEDLHSLVSRSKAVIEVGDLPHKVKAFPGEISMIFQNLIANALKFSKKDRFPQIQIKSKKVDGGWEFTVKDNGIGIARKDYDKIFVIFQKLNRSDEYSGTGIGLAHAKKIAEKHGGRIWVESEPGSGSTFYFTILTEYL
ncbi:PAS domain S-box protein [Fulvivirga ulvae]|uniref:PAS domain-containing sensor histidine kinase n=1 Tax=Fulvivirga ulvae TaxID=2904245 RepID=UPI001F292F08|nr:PAS domain-containing sensor histidine kinase [Fulvivirga ulvae]UII32873.1 PAS domain S-box protein [Fulvivirga ulvae]